MDYLKSLHESKIESEKRLSHLENHKYDSPIALNNYFDAMERDINIKCRIERVEHENKMYGQYSQFASPYKLMGTIESPEGPKIGLCKSNMAVNNIKK